MGLVFCESLQASPPEGSKCCLAAYRQTELRSLEARQRNHISKWLEVKMRRGSAAVLAHNLHVAGRRGRMGLGGCV